MTAGAATAAVMVGMGLVPAYAASTTSTNLLPNGSFDSGSSSGWKAGNAKLSLASPGYGGSAGALKVAWNGKGSTYTVSAAPAPASQLAAGTQVYGGGEVMAPAGRKLCLLLQEHGTAQLITACVTATGSWQALTATLTVKGAGDSVGFLIRQYGPKPGDTFQADSLSVTTASASAPSGTGSGDPVIAAAGDIACDPANSAFKGGTGTANLCREKYTSDLLVNSNLTAVLALGDTQYNCAGYQAFLQSYAPTWGRVLSITHPVPGNHEYMTSGGTGCNASNKGAAGYFQYFGNAAGNPGQGYYSFNIGTWHIIALNSACSSIGGCGLTSPQGKWLANDLASHTNFCTLAFWHVPLFSSGGRASSSVEPFWQLLYQYNADVVLNGHDHIYERFAPQTPSGTLDTSQGIREFIVGTGGAVHTGLVTIAANSEVRNNNTFGVLELTLHPTGYDWQFVPQAGQTFTDSGSGACH